MRKLCIVVFLLVANFASSQNTTLIKNRNFRAAELKHDLNSRGDTLVLEGIRDIIKVVISNDSFHKSFPIVNKKTKIPLVDLPLGRFTTEVKLENKLIILTLLRHKPIDPHPNASISLSNTHSIETDLKLPRIIANNSSMNSDVALNENEGLNTHESLNANEGLNKAEDLDENKTREVRFYWIVNYINKGQSSQKLMKIADLETVKRFIRKHEIDHRTKSGIMNELTIWEVYDTSKFMKFKRLNPDYANAKNSDCFNTTPFYQLLSKAE
ncbi:MAG: hypothetical protein NWP87_08090 [Winogradskyella sp.]|nr:hypothetical protein [Winogradskyella sp.]